MAKRITSLLLVVLLLAGVVPVTMVGSASADEIAILETTEESTIPETTEPATESAFTEESTDMPEDSEELEFQFAIDAGVYEKYILEHMDSSLVGSGDALIPYDLLTVKQTLVSGEILDALGGSHTIDGLWTDHNGDGLSDYDDALLIQKGAEVYLYMVSADAPYLVGYVDTLNAPSYRVEDHLFAENTNEGNLLSGCIYDAETGLVYVPVGESLRVDETGKLLIGRVQIQLLYVSSCQEPAAAAFSMRNAASSLFSSEIIVEVIQPDKETSNVRNVSVSFMDTHISLNVDTGDNCIDYVTVNGCPVEQNQWAYTDSTLQIAHQPASVGSVTVVLKDPEDTSVTLGDLMSASTYGYGAAMESLTSYYPDTWQVDRVPTVGQCATFGLSGTKGHYGATMTFDNDTDVKTYYSTKVNSMTEGYYGSFNGSGSLNATVLIIVVTNYSKISNYPKLIDDWARVAGGGLYKRVVVPAGTYSIGNMEVTLPNAFDGALDCCHIGVRWSLDSASGTTPNYSPSYPESQCTKMTILEVKTNADGKSGSMMVGFAVPTTNSQAGTGAYLIRWEIPDNEQGFTLSKSIAASASCAAQIKDNPMYSLGGAKYQVSVGGTVTETLTTDANGRAVSSRKYAIGTVVTVREISAPSGFKLDSTTYTLTISDGENTVYVSDEPVFDPPFAMTKVDRDTLSPQGSGSFSGAVFKWEYFANTSWSGTPLRTWYFRTNENGVVDYRADYLAPGYMSDALYTNTDGYYQIPLGTVKITEIRNSLGYTVLPDSLYCSISADPSSVSGASVDWTAESWGYLMNMAVGNYGVYEPIDTTVLGGITIQKEDGETGSTAPDGASFAGCEFTIYNRSDNAVKIGDTVAEPGEACFVLTIDETGKASTGNVFPVGTYEVRETKGNAYYAQNIGWTYTFTVDGTTANPNFTVSCPNTRLSASIRLEKVGTSGQTVPGAKFRLEWSDDGHRWNPVTKSAGITLGGCTSEDLDEHGCLTTGSDGVVVFTGLYPTVHYRVTEVESPPGYQLLKEPILVKQLTPENAFQASYQVVNDDVFRLPATGSSGFHSVSLGVYLLCTALMLALFPMVRKREG